MAENMAGKTLAVLLAGGLCPGMNHVTKALFERATALGMRVVGVRHGMDGLLRDPPDFQELDANYFRFINRWGGVELKVSRRGFTNKLELLDPALAALTGPPIKADCLATVGGDDTFTSLIRLMVRAGELGLPLRGVHLPKTIDNDLPLPMQPAMINTFGFDTAASAGARQLLRLVWDFDSRENCLCLPVCMGRDAGFLAVELVRKARQKWLIKRQIGYRVMNPYVFIPEMFPPETPLEHVVQCLTAACRLTLEAAKERYVFAPPVIVVSEGVFARLDPAGQEEIDVNAERDPAGHIKQSLRRIAEGFCGRVLPRLHAAGFRPEMKPEGLGYTLRTEIPLTPVDKAYTVELGRCAVDYLAEGGSGAMIWVDHGKRRELSYEHVRRNQRGCVVTRSLDLTQRANAALLKNTLQIVSGK